MLRYILTATFNKMTTTIPINARDDEMAKVLAFQKIAVNSASDKRFTIGEIVLRDPEETKVWSVDEEKQ